MLVTVNGGAAPAGCLWAPKKNCIASGSSASHSGLKQQHHNGPEVLFTTNQVSRLSVKCDLKKGRKRKKTGR